MLKKFQDAHLEAMQDLRSRFQAANLDHPFLKEVDRLEFTHKGFDCLISRHYTMGHWCAYAGVKPGHPYHGKSYEEVKLKGHSVNYSQKCEGVVCHLPKPGETDNVWWFGMDFAHARDEQPITKLFEKTIHLRPWPSGMMKFHYWTQKEVIRETKKLADQLAAAL